MAPTRTTPARLIAYERQRKALELRKAGLTYAQIADQCGYSSPATARKAVVSILESTQRESVNDFRTIQFERLSYMIMKLWPRVQDGDEKAIMATASLMERQDRLMGTEAATKVDAHVHHTGGVLVIDGSEDDYVEALEKMAAAAGAKPIEKPEDDIIDAEVVDDPQPALPVGDDGVTPLGHLAEPEVVEVPCPRYVRSADPERAATGLCARCAFVKDQHNNG